MSLLYNVLDKLRDIAAKDSKTDVSDAIKSAQTTESAFRKEVRVVAEGFSSEEDAVMAKIASGQLAIYDAMSDSSNPAYSKLVDMYNSISSEYRLHPDDDFEQIEDRMMDQIEADYGQSDVSAPETIHEAGCTCEGCNGTQVESADEEDVFQKHADSQGIARKDQLPSTPREIRVEHAEYNADRKLNEGFNRKVNRMVNEAVTANVSPDNNVSVTATGNSTAEEADAISAILRNAGIVNKDPVSSMDPMGAGAMSSGYDTLDPMGAVDPIGGEMTGADIEVAPFGGDLNGPTDDIAPEAGLNTPDYSDGVDDFGVDYSIDADDGLEGGDMSLPSDGDIDVVGDTDGLGDGTDMYAADEEEIAHESVMSEWANSKNGDEEERGDYKDELYMLQTLAGGLNAPKKHANVNNPGDNSMNKDTPTDGGMHDASVIKTESKREQALNADAAKLEEELLAAFRNFK